MEKITPSDTVSYTYDSTFKDKLVSYDGEAITYDVIGNPQSYRGMTFTWKKGRELNQVQKDNKTYTYRYDANGMRNRKYLEDGTVIYQLEGTSIVGEQKLTNAGNLAYEMEFIYDSTGNILAFLYNGDEYYYVKNLQGDVVGILNAQGIEVVSYQYDSWGKLLDMNGDQTVGNVNPFRYRGYYYDVETGFYYLGRRYYDPEICRFVNTDGELAGISDGVQGYNLFAYCFNNPVNMCDPNGTWPSWNTFFKTIAVVAAAVAVVATAVAFAPIIAGVGAVAGTGALVVAGVAAAVSASAVIAAGIQSKVNNMTTQKSYNNQSVYIMKKKGTDEIGYIGRTNDPKRRQNEHKRDKSKQHLDNLEVKITGLTVRQARLAEQLLISAYTIDKLDNARREIAVGKVKNYSTYLNDIINIFGGYAESEYLSLLGR